MSDVMTSLGSYQQLDAEDQVRCLAEFLEPLPEKYYQHKYLKRTDAIANKTKSYSGDLADCFMTFDIFAVANTFYTLVFMLQGVHHAYRYVLYFNVMSAERIEESISQFVCDILINILTREVTLLPHLCLKFVLCRRDVRVLRALELMQQSAIGFNVYNAFVFIDDPLDLQRTFQFNRSVRTAINDLLRSRISENNVCEFFCEREEYFKETENPDMLKLILDFHSLARDLLETRQSDIILYNCTYWRSKDFNKYIILHSQALLEAPLSRAAVFSYIRAIVIVYDY